MVVHRFLMVGPSTRRCHTRRGLSPSALRIPGAALRAPPALAATLGLRLASGSHPRSARSRAPSRCPLPRRTATSPYNHANARRVAHFLPRLGTGLLTDSSVYSSCATGLAPRFHHLSMPTEALSITIAARKDISHPRNPGEKPHQVSLDHYRGARACTHRSTFELGLVRTFEHVSAHLD